MDYTPYGPEWVKEVKKMNKDSLVEMLKGALITNENLKAEVRDIQEAADTVDTDADSQKKGYYWEQHFSGWHKLKKWAIPVGHKASPNIPNGKQS